MREDWIVKEHLLELEGRASNAKQAVSIFSKPFCPMNGQIQGNEASFQAFIGL